MATPNTDGPAVSPAAASILADPVAAGFPEASLRWTVAPPTADDVGDPADLAPMLAEHYDRATAPLPLPRWMRSPSTVRAGDNTVTVVGTGDHDDDPERGERDLDACLAVLRTPEAVRLMGVAEGPYVPAVDGVRVGFAPGQNIGAGMDAHEAARRDAARETGGTVEHTCALTGSTFWLPIGAPVPTLFADLVRVDGSLADRAQTWTVAPALVHGGPDDLARAAWSAAMDKAFSAAAALVDALDALQLARAVEAPDAVGIEPPGTAYGPDGLSGIYKQPDR